MLFWLPDKSTRNGVIKAITDSLKAEKWTQKTNTIKAETRKTGKGVASIVNAKKQKEQAIARSLNSTNEANLSKKANELIEIATMIKQQLQTYKEEVKDYHENAEIMEMIFSLGMAEEEEEVYLHASESHGKKRFDERLASDLVKFLDRAIEEFDGWIPLAEAYCRFNRARGTGTLPPEDMKSICAKLPEVSDGRYLFIPDFKVSETETIKMICKSELSVERVLAQAIEILEEDSEKGFSVGELADRMGMNPGILEPFLQAALGDGRIAVDRQDLLGERFFANEVLAWTL